MKRRIIIAVFIFLLLVTVTATSHILINNRLSRISETATSAYKAVCENKSPQNEASALKKEWQRSRRIFYIFLNHRNVIEIEDNIESIEKLLSEEMYVNLKILLIDTINQVNDLKKTVIISIENIF